MLTVFTLFGVRTVAIEFCRCVVIKQDLNIVFLKTIRLLEEKMVDLRERMK